MAEDTLGITTDDPMCLAVQIGDGRWVEIEGVVSSVDGYCHKIEFPGFMTRSGESFGVTATFHIVEKAWRDGDVDRGNISQMVMVNGLLMTVETVAKGVELVRKQSPSPALRLTVTGEAMADKEAVLELGVEGGGATIYRTPLAAGVWQFHVEGGFMLLDKEIGSCSSISKPFQTIQEAIRSIAEDGSWVFFSPISIHPKYRIAVRLLVQEIVRNLSDERIKTWNDNHKRRWWRLCRREPPRPQAETDLFGDPI